jgi:phage major head subunit gpT-like protein
MQTSPAALQAAFYAFSTAFQSGYGRVTPWSRQFALEVPSATAENRYYWMAAIPKMREWIGERVIQNMASRAFAIQNKDWELTIGVKKTDFEDDMLGQYAPLFGMMGEQAQRLPDDLIGALLKDGENQDAWDGQRFFDVDHPVKISDGNAGIQANLFTGAPLTRANFNTVRTTMRTYKDEDGRPLAINPRFLIVPPQLEQTAKDIVIADTVPNVAGTASQTNTNKGDATIVVVEDLSDRPTEWYLADLSKPMKPFIYQVRKAANFVRKDSETDDNVFLRKEALYGVDARGNAGFGLPLLIAKGRP